MSDVVREWKIDKLKYELKELENEMEGIDRMLAEVETIKKATLENKAILQAKIIELKRVLFNDFGVVV